MAFEAEHYPNKVHLYAASLENPEDFAPTFHVNAESRLSWLHLSDDLPRCEGTVLDSCAAN